MRDRMRLFLAATTVSLTLGPFGIAVPATRDAPEGPPDATINLATKEGVILVQSEWRYSDTKIIEVDFREPGPDRKPTGKPNRTFDIFPKAGGADFDDSRWEILDPTTLDHRRSTGRVCFNWYRIKVTIPERVGNFDPTGTTVVFEIVVDDYAEVWVDGKLPREIGQSGGSMVRGFNAPNRLVVARDVKPGQKIQIAVFGMNGPISDSPENFIWVRYSKLDFFKATTRSRSR